MTYSYNLIDERWVPCVDFDGHVQQLSLRDALFEAHRYRELGGESPLVTAALYRLLLAILHRVFGPEDRDAWRALWAQGRWDAGSLEVYLSKWRHRFDLFDEERPFCQADHPTIPVNPIGNLLHELCKGDTFYDHRTLNGIELPPADAARHLLAALAFGRWMTKGPYGQLPFGTCARGIVFLAKGQTLFEDLALNLLRYPTRDDVLPHDHGKDAPSWEMADPFNPSRSMPFGYLDYLTWLSRRILLIPEQQNGQVRVLSAKIAPGLRMSDELRNPAMAHKGCQKRGWKSWLAYTEGRALWRDSTPLFRLPTTSSPETRDSYPPAVLDWLATLVDETPELGRHRTRRLVGLGMAGDLNQYRVHFYRREELPLPLSFLRDQDLVTHLEAALAEAEGAGRQLWGALSTLAVELLFHKQDARLSRQERDERDALLRSWAAERRYWAALEVPFYSLLTGLSDDPQAARQAWTTVVRRAAWAALDAVAENQGDDPSALKAAVLARGKIGAGLAKVLDTEIQPATP